MAVEKPLSRPQLWLKYMLLDMVHVCILKTQDEGVGRWGGA